MKVVAGPGVPGTLTFSMAGWASGASAQNAVIAGVSGTTQGNYQFLLTLANWTYVYLFGEKMGDFTVSGIAGYECGDYIHGLTHAISYYNTYAISITGMPIALTFGGFSTWAFLVGGTFQYMNPKSRLARFQFRFKTLTQ
jgi:hypothetical protein